MFDFLSKRQINGIKRWLTLTSTTEKHRKRPFCKHRIGCQYDPCYRLFPDMGGHADKKGGVSARYCPCETYGTDYVTRVAREIVRIWEVEHA